MTGSTIQANGLQIHYKEYGSGYPLILLHGSFDCTGEMWAQHIPFLESNHWVLVPDARGHGGTDNPGDEITLPLLADDVAAFAEALNLRKPVLCGTSMGGRTVLETGMRHADLPGALIAVAAQTHRRFPGNFAEQRRSIGINAPGDIDTGVLEKTDPKRVERLKASHTRSPGQWKHLLLALSHAWENALRPLDDYKKIAVPTLAMVGDRDPLVPVEFILEMYRALPNAELAVLPNHDHCSPIRRAGSPFAALVGDFLSRNAPSLRAG